MLDTNPTVDFVEERQNVKLDQIVSQFQLASFSVVNTKNVRHCEYTPNDLFSPKKRVVSVLLS